MECYDYGPGLQAVSDVAGELGTCKATLTKIDRRAGRQPARFEYMHGKGHRSVVWTRTAHGTYGVREQKERRRSRDREVKRNEYDTQ